MREFEGHRFPQTPCQETDEQLDTEIKSLLMLSAYLMVRSFHLYSSQDGGRSSFTAIGNSYVRRLPPTRQRGIALMDPGMCVSVCFYHLRCCCLSEFPPLMSWCCVEGGRNVHARLAVL